jgi:AraC family transcriptional regulator
MLLAMPIVNSVSLPSIRVEYDRSAPSRERTAITRAGSIAVAFTSQRRAVWQVASTCYSNSFPACVSVPGAIDLIWHKWSDTSEAVEFWLNDTWLEEISGLSDALHRLRPRLHFDDVIFHAIASRFRQLMISGVIEPMRFEELALGAAQRLLRNAGWNPKSARTAPLDDRCLAKIAEFIDAHLALPITLDALAAEAGMSVFHFAKRFRAATGISPYAWVIGWRMNRAMQLLRRGGRVRRVAIAVGYSEVSHFRRQFWAHWRQSPGHLEGQKKKIPRMASPSRS